MDYYFTNRIMPTSASGNCAEVTEIPATECEILLDLYNSTNGEQWNANLGWNVTNTPCSWTGIICGDGQVTKVSLQRNQLSGSIPAELGNLTSAGGRKSRYHDRATTRDCPYNINCSCRGNPLWLPLFESGMDISALLY